MQPRVLPLLFTLALAWAAQGQTPPIAGTTAFALVKEGDKVVARQAKDRITEIRSDRSTTDLTPDTWYIDYFDPTAAFKMTEVKFVAGKVEGITHPKHWWDSLTGGKQLEWKKLKINSDRALAIATKETALKSLHLQAVQFWLDRAATGSTWKVRFWGSPLDKPEQTAEIGDVYLSGRTGEIIKDDLRVKSGD